MADFKISYNKVMLFEGKYSNDPLDIGGQTYKGISRRFHPSWSGWNIIDSYTTDPGFPGCLDDDTKLQDLVHLFYKENFWNIWMGDLFPQVVADEMFDISVNMNHTRAISFLQTALNCLNNNQKFYDDLVVDGSFGNKTFRAMGILFGRGEAGLVVKILNVLQGSHYIEFMKKSPIQEKFARGWFSRVDISKN